VVSGTRSDASDSVPAEGDVPAYLRDVRLALVALQPAATIGLGRGFQLAVEVPLVFKDKLYGYSRDGAAFVPEGLPERLTRVGIGDVRVRFGLTGRVPNAPLILSFAVGAALPTGATGDHPRDLVFGNGTVDPVVNADLVVTTRPFGLIAGASARFPLYENGKAYQGSVTVEGTVGTMFRPPRPADKLQLLALAHVTHVEPERWQGSAWVNSGRDVIAVSLGALYGVTPKLVVHAQMRVNVFEVPRGEQFSQPLTLSVGMSGTIDLKKKHDDDDGHGH